MARQKQPKGICAFCGKEVAKSGATRHLASCAKRQEAIAQAEQKKTKSETLYHLRVQDAYNPNFWLNLEMRGNKTLGDLDMYLREIWLECCGHLSEFSLGGAFGRQIGMSRKISDVFSSTDELTHISG